MIASVDGDSPGSQDGGFVPIVEHAERSVA